MRQGSGYPLIALHKFVLGRKKSLESEAIQANNSRGYPLLSLTHPAASQILLIRFAQKLVLGVNGL
jgi:hypothetical protein